MNEFIRIINDKELNRVQLKFAEVPSREILNDLKHHGWHWSPKNFAWQRLNTQNGLDDAARIKNKYYPDNKKELENESDYRLNLDIAKKFIPPAQYAVTLEACGGEDGDFFKEKLANIVSTAERIKTESELINADGTHPFGFRYFAGDSTFYICEWDGDDIVYGYTILNKDFVNAEWGESLLSEIIHCSPYIEMDYHRNDSTIEAALHQDYPDIYNDPDKLKNLHKQASIPKISAIDKNTGVVQYIDHTVLYDPVIKAAHDKETEELDISAWKENINTLKKANGLITQNEEITRRINSIQEWLGNHSDPVNNELKRLEKQNQDIDKTNVITDKEAAHTAFHKAFDLRIEILKKILSEKDNSKIEEHKTGVAFDHYFLTLKIPETERNLIITNAKEENERNGYAYSADDLEVFLSNWKNAVKENNYNELFYIQNILEGANFHSVVSMLAEQRYSDLERNIIDLKSSFDRKADEKDGLTGTNNSGVKVKNNLTESPQISYHIYGRNNSISENKEVENGTNSTTSKEKSDYVRESTGMGESGTQDSLKDNISRSRQSQISERSVYSVSQIDRAAEERNDRTDSIPFEGRFSQNAQPNDGNGSREVYSGHHKEKWMEDERSNSRIDTESSGNGIRISLTPRKIKQLREQCRTILDKPDDQLTDEDKNILSVYEGAGGIDSEKNRTASGILSEFYTPDSVIQEVWKLVDFYAPDAVSVLEPSAGTGRFASNRIHNNFIMYELDDVSSRIASILHPEAKIFHSAYQAQFFDKTGRVYNKNYKQPLYDVVIGNPPYGSYNDKWKGLGEGIRHSRYEEYFIDKGLDALKNEKSILAYVVPSSFLDKSIDNIKIILSAKGDLIDAWRLPRGTFPTTEVGTDIIIMKKGSCKPENLSFGNYFKDNPSHILGISKDRQGRFGIEKYIDVHDGLSVEDELRKISSSIISKDITSIVLNSSVINTSVKGTLPETSDISHSNKYTANKDNSQEEYKDSKGLFKTKHNLTMEEFSRYYTGNNYVASEYQIWASTSWDSTINMSKLSSGDIAVLKQNIHYIQVEPGKYVNKMIYCSGNIYEKIALLQNKINQHISQEEKKLYEDNINLLHSLIPSPLSLEKIHFSPQAELAKEFTVKRTLSHLINGKSYIKEYDSAPSNINLQEDFIVWATNWNNINSNNERTSISDWTTANVTREDFPENISWNDITDFIDNIPVIARRTWDEEQKKAAAIEAEQKRTTRRDIADKLFDRYVHEALPEEDMLRLTAEWNKRFNNTVNLDYSKLPLFVDGMSTFRDGKPFMLFPQQVKGTSFLSQNGTGLLAYDVGVGKTVVGIVATVNQIQTKRAKRPLIIVPKSVYSNWVHNTKELFPMIKVNELANFSPEALTDYRTENYGLSIPEGSITICTNEALQRISFEDYNLEKGGALYEEFSNLLSTDDDGSTREKAASEQKIKNELGRASQAKDGFVFYERTGFDNLTVDEAHRFKNLYRVPRNKKKDKKQANEWAGLGQGTPSKRALKLFGMTQLTQRNNENRNVFLLTATPFTNSPLEVYSMLSYIAREKMREMHIYDLKSFLTEFAQTKTEWSVDAKGEIQPKQVMKNFRSLNSLQNLLKQFIDKVDGEEAGIRRPKRTIHKVELNMTEVQQKIVERETERMLDPQSIKNGGVLVAMNNMRMSMLSPALCNPAEYEFKLPSTNELVESSPKLKFVCDTVSDCWHEQPFCGQVIYMPRGVNEMQRVKKYLVKKGIPDRSISIIAGGLNLSEEKIDDIKSAFNNVVDPLKVIIGSEKISEGIDLNGNSIALYNTMLGWNPTESVQVEGRVWRQGNAQGNVHISYPLMIDSIDALMFQKHDEKSSRINALFNYKGTDALDVQDINPEELKFDLIKDPAKRADFIINQKTSELQKTLTIIDGRKKTISEIDEKRFELSRCDAETKERQNEYEMTIKSESRDSWNYRYAKAGIEECRKELNKNEAKINTLSKRLTKLDINSFDEIHSAITKLTIESNKIETKIKEIKLSKDKIIHEERLKLLEKKIVTASETEIQKQVSNSILSNIYPAPVLENSAIEAHLNEKSGNCNNSKCINESKADELLPISTEVCTASNGQLDLFSIPILQKENHELEPDGEWKSTKNKTKFQRKKHFSFKNEKEKGCNLPEREI